MIFFIIIIIIFMFFTLTPIIYISFSIIFNIFPLVFSILKFINSFYPPSISIYIINKKRMFWFTLLTLFNIWFLFITAHKRFITFLTLLLLLNYIPFSEIYTIRSCPFIIINLRLWDTFFTVFFTWVEKLIIVNNCLQCLFW